MNTTFKTTLLPMLLMLFVMGCGGSGPLTISGTLSGLSNDSTLIIQNHSGENLTLTQNGKFAFETKLSKEDKYKVVIDARPTGQKCLIKNGEGTITKSIKNIVITCSLLTWTYPSSFQDYISVVNTDGMSGERPFSAMDASGNTLIAWSADDNDGDKRVYVSEYRNGKWTHPPVNSSISPAGFSIGRPPTVVMDDHDNAIIVWVASSGADYRTYISEYRDGKWKHPVDETDAISPTGSSVYRTRAAMDNKGNAIIVWEQNNGTDHAIFKSEYRNGSWKHPSTLATDSISPSGTNAENPEVAMNDKGETMIVWTQSDGTDDQVFMSVYRDGQWTHPADQADNISPAGEDTSLHKIEMADNGDAVIIWEQNNNVGNTAVFKSEYRNGAWKHPMSLNNHISLSSSSIDQTQLAMDHAGNTAIVWHQSDGDNHRVFYSQYMGGVWDHPSDIEDNILSPKYTDADGPWVAYVDDEAVVVWKQKDLGGYDRTFLAEYRGGAWIKPVSPMNHINPAEKTDRSQRLGTVSMSKSGEAVVSWYGVEESNSFFKVFKAEYR